MKKEIDLTQGNLLKSLMIFIFPVIISNLLQISFNIADTVIVGRFAGKESLAAVGSTTSMINLIISLFSGLSVGINIIVSRCFGAKKFDDVSKCVHTSVATSLVCGVALGILGFFMSKTIATLAGTPKNVIESADLYLKIYFLGVPAMLLYNFESSVLRALGNTRIPTLYLTISGVLNVILNIVFVVVFHLDVAGVALATSISQYLTAILCTVYLLKNDGKPCQLFLSKIRIHKKILVQILANGIPVGLQGVLCSLGGTLVQISLNSLGSDAVAASSASNGIQNIIYTVLYAVYIAIFTAISQNYGSKNKKRIKKVLVTCILFDVVVGLLMGTVAYIFRYNLVGLYVTDRAVIELGVQQLTLMGLTMCLCGIMDIFAAFFRGMGYSVMPVLISVLGQFGIRAIWGITVFAYFNSFMSIVWVNPVIWIFTIIMYIIAYFILHKRMFERMYNS